MYNKKNVERLFFKVQINEKIKKMEAIKKIILLLK